MPVAAPTRAETVAALDGCWSSLEQFCAALSPADWQTPSLCPAWTVHGVMTHLTGIEEALAGWTVETETGPFGGLAQFHKDAKAWSGVELLERFRAAVERRRAQLAAADDTAWARPSWTPVGVHTWGRFQEVRVFDCWVHEQDMRTPLDRPGHEDGPAAELSLREVELSWGFVMGKKVGLTEGESVTVHVTGPYARDLSATVVEGRARPVEALAEPTAELSVDFLTFMLLCCGRIDPEAQLAAGTVTLRGDPDLARKAATKLAFTF
ncbi:MAG: maleylpyruvate isomerase family mycothiol-dependent enzyme [Acidimicrobiales bacterium]